MQYLDYLGNVARLDFGNTISDNRPVLDIIRDQGGATLTLTLGAFLIALLIGLPLGRMAGRYRDTARTPASASSAWSPTPPRSSGPAS